MFVAHSKFAQARVVFVELSIALACSKPLPCTRCDADDSASAFFCLCQTVEAEVVSLSCNLPSKSR